MERHRPEQALRQLVALPALEQHRDRDLEPAESSLHEADDVRRRPRRPDVDVDLEVARAAEIFRFDLVAEEHWRVLADGALDDPAFFCFFVIERTRKMA